MTSYVEEITRWRERQDASLRTEDGWLTLAGLFWLEEGDNRAGTDSSCAIRLPEAAPPVLGMFQRRGREVIFQAATAAYINGEPAGERVLRSDMPGPPDLLTFGSFTLFVIERGDRIGLRLRDRNHPALQAFTGRRWFPITIPTILGDASEQLCPGAAVFTLAGQEFRLEPTAGKNGELFFVIRDATSSHETYGAARFLYADPPRDGRVVLDFNQAYNPPCAFTEFATCPLPPRQNILPVRIEAGELDSGMGH